MGQLLDVGVLVFRDGLRLADDAVDPRQDLDPLGISAGSSDRLLDLAVVPLRDLPVGEVDEEHLAPAGRELAAAAALAGLDDDRAPLGRARHGEWPARPEPLAAVIE